MGALACPHADAELPEAAAASHWQQVQPCQGLGLVNSKTLNPKPMC